MKVLVFSAILWFTIGGTTALVALKKADHNRAVARHLQMIDAFLSGVECGQEMTIKQIKGGTKEESMTYFFVTKSNFQNYIQFTVK